MGLAAASFRPGLFASPILFALFCWPFLAAWVLWAARCPVRAGSMARLGGWVTALALLGCSSGLSWGQGVCLAMAGCVPALLFTLRGAASSSPSVSSPASSGQGEDGAEPGVMSPQAGNVADAMAAYLPLLVTGCTLMGFLLRAPLAALFADGAGVVLLACWDGRATRRALPAWEMVRLRLGGMILAGMGLMVMQGGPLFSSNGTAREVGAVLALVGLSMMAGLGSLTSSRAELALLDVGLRFVPLAMLPLVAVSPLLHRLMILAGLLALGGTVLARSVTLWAVSGPMEQRSAARGEQLPLLAWLTGLGLLAAGCGDMLSLLLLYGAALLAMALRLGFRQPVIIRALEGRPGLQGQCAALPGQVVLPVIMVVLAGLVPQLGWGERAGLLACVLLGFHALRLEGISASLLLLWQRGGVMLRVVLLLLVLLGLLAVGLLDEGWLSSGQAVPGMEGMMRGEMR